VATGGVRSARTPAEQGGSVSVRFGASAEPLVRFYRN